MDAIFMFWFLPVEKEVILLEWSGVKPIVAQLEELGAYSNS